VPGLPGDALVSHAPGWTVTWWALRRLEERRTRENLHDIRVTTGGRPPRTGAAHWVLAVELAKRGL
jgi:hypothetical protein